MKIKLLLFGIAAVILLVTVALLAGRFSFMQRVIIEVNELFADAVPDNPKLLLPKEINHLPEPVQRWLAYSNVIGREKIYCVRLKQKGKFRLAPDKDWMPFTAEEYYTTGKPAFLWSTKMQMAPMVSIIGRDRYYQGHGHMLIKLLSLIPVADATGPEIDQATLLRCLNEIMWFPGAAVNEYIQWDAVNANSARATMSYAGISASAVFYFNDRGQLTNMTADRFRYINGKYQLDRWSTPITGYAEFQGVRVPSRGEGVWKLEAGDFVYIRLQITDIEYNKPMIYK